MTAKCVPVANILALLVLTELLPLLVVLDYPSLGLLRVLIAVVVVLLLPGLLVTVLLQLELDGWERLAFAFGLSLVLVMALGAGISGLHSVGVDRPLDGKLLAAVYSLMVGVLVLVVGAFRPQAMVLPRVAAPPICVSLASVVIALVVIGARVANVTGEPAILMLALVILSMLPLIIFLPRFCPTDSYPAFLALGSAALLLHRSLISWRFTGFDVHWEYFFASRVLERGYWTPDIAHNYNSTLSVVALPPVFSAVSGIDLVLVYKVVFPLMFALVPVTLYLAWRRVWGEGPAFLATTFLVLTQTFYGVMPHQPRMQIALLFLALLFLCARLPRRLTTTLLPLVFGLGLVVAHYSVAYFLMPFLLVCAALRSIRQLGWQLGLGARATVVERPDHLDPLTSWPFLRFFVVVALAWYIFASPGGTTFATAVHTFEQLGANLRNDLFRADSSEGLDILTKDLTPLREVARYVYLGFQVLMLVGLIEALRRWWRGEIDTAWAAAGIPAIILNAAAVLVPNFASTLHLDRIYQLTMVFLAPLAILGAMTLSTLLTRRVPRASLGMSQRWERAQLHVAALAVVLVLYGLLSTGVLYQLRGERPNLVPLSSGWMEEHGTESELLAFYGSYPKLADAAAARWALAHGIPATSIYADLYGRAYVMGDYFPFDDLHSIDPAKPLPGGVSVLLWSLNLREGVMAGPYERWTRDGEDWWPMTELVGVTGPMSKLYDNASAGFFRTNEIGAAEASNASRR